MEEMVKEYNTRFGLDRPLLAQYGSYLYDTAHLDFNYSIANYPRTVKELIVEALPWTVGLLATTTLLSFTIGTLLGALLAWPRSPRWLRTLMPPLWALHAIPFFLFGLILIYLFAFQVQLLPMFGGYSPGAAPGSPGNSSATSRCIRSCRGCRSFWCRSAAGRWRCGA